jgi:hypothetical protein
MYRGRATRVVMCSEGSPSSLASLDLSHVHVRFPDVIS